MGGRLLHGSLDDHLDVSTTPRPQFHRAQLHLPGLSQQKKNVRLYYSGNGLAI